MDTLVNFCILSKLISGDAIANGTIIEQRLGWKPIKVSQYLPLCLQVHRSKARLFQYVMIF